MPGSSPGMTKKTEPSVCASALAIRLDYPQLRQGRAKWQRAGSSLGCGPGGRYGRHIANPDDALVLADMESSRSTAVNKSGRADAFAIVRYVAQAPRLLRQVGLGAKRKARIGWPIDVEADDIPQLAGEQGHRWRA